MNGHSGVAGNFADMNGTLVFEGLTCTAIDEESVIWTALLYILVQYAILPCMMLSKRYVHEPRKSSYS